MNRYAPPQEPAPYPPPPGAPPGDRPSIGVKVLAWFQIALGALGIFAAPCTLAMQGFARDPVSVRLHEITYSGFVGVWTYTHLGIGSVLAIVLLASGIGLLSAKSWARLASMVYATATLVLWLGGQIVTFLFIYPALDQLAEEFANNAIAQAAVMGGRIGGMIGGLLGTILPVTILIVMTRPRVKAQFAA